MKYFAILGVGCLYFTSSNAQTSVYQCTVDPSVTQAEIDANDYYSDGCISFDQSPYNFDQNDNKTVVASNQIDVEPGFTAKDFSPNEGMSLLLCNDLRDVVCFSHSDLSTVEALKKFEIGIGLPEHIELRIQDFINSGDTTGNQINPYLEWHLNAEAVFTHRATNESHTIDGFYFQGFEREQSNPNTQYWGWNELPTTHNMRFRFAPPLEGGWDVTISVSLQDGSSFNYCPFVLNVTPNTENDGYVKVASNKRVLERNGELFFPVGQDLHWPPDHNDATHKYGYFTGAYGTEPVNSLSHNEFESDMVELKTRGVNSFRMLLSPSSLDIEFEKVGDYTDRLNYGWEIDNIIEKAEELDLYIHFNMLVHYGLERNSTNYCLGWDWSSDYVAYGAPVHLGHYGYRDFFVADDTPELFLSDPTCIKYYQQKIRYLIARYGYSTHIYMLELLSEINNVGNKSEIFGPGQHDTYFSAYTMDSQQPARVANWHDIMSKYIKNELGHKEHLVCASYAGYGHADGANGDYTYSIPEIDVVSWNNYSDLINKFHVYGPDRVTPIQALYDKPIFWSETGPIDPNWCDNGASYRKEAWMTAFTGIAGFNFWSGIEDVFHPQWDYLANVRNFIEGNPTVANLFLSHNWYQEYRNDVGPLNGGPSWNSAQQKELNSIRLNYIQSDGSIHKVSVGVISNMTDNYSTNAVNDSTWCSDSPVSSLLEYKTNLLQNDQPIYLEDFYGQGVFYSQWFNTWGNFHSSLNSINAPLIYPHPESCVTNCQSVNFTPEIPFIITWDNSAFLNSPLAPITEVPNGSMHNLKIHTGNELSTTSYQLKVSPSPASHQLTIECNDPFIEELILCDGSGKRIRTIPKGSSPIDIAHLETGFYMIIALDSNQTIKYQTRWVKL